MTRRGLLDVLGLRVTDVVVVALLSGAVLQANVARVQLGYAAEHQLKAAELVQMDQPFRTLQGQLDGVHSHISHARSALGEGDSKGAADSIQLALEGVQAVERGVSRDLLAQVSSTPPGLGTPTEVGRVMNGQGHLDGIRASLAAADTAARSGGKEAAFSDLAEAYVRVGELRTAVVQLTHEFQTREVGFWGLNLNTDRTNREEDWRHKQAAGSAIRRTMLLAGAAVAVVVAPGFARSLATRWGLPEKWSALRPRVARVTGPVSRVWRPVAARLRRRR